MLTPTHLHVNKVSLTLALDEVALLFFDRQIFYGSVTANLFLAKIGPRTFFASKKTVQGPVFASKKRSYPSNFGPSVWTKIDMQNLVLDRNLLQSIAKFGPIQNHGLKLLENN